VSDTYHSYGHECTSTTAHPHNVVDHWPQMTAGNGGIETVYFRAALHEYTSTYTPVRVIRGTWYHASANGGGVIPNANGYKGSERSSGPMGPTRSPQNGRPLYGWHGDSNPGDVTGQVAAGFSIAKPE
jgi:hypothetical protein